jgi:hypothetical protein
MWSPENVGLSLWTGKEAKSWVEEQLSAHAEDSNSVFLKGGSD